MATLIIALPLLPGKAEAWRRANQEMLESRRDDYQSSRHHLSITRELSWLAQTPQGEIALLYLETVGNGHQTLVELAQSLYPFDGWFRQQILNLCGYDLAHPKPGWPGELLSDWTAFTVAAHESEVNL